MPCAQLPPGPGAVAPGQSSLMCSHGQRKRPGSDAGDVHATPGSVIVQCDPGLSSLSAQAEETRSPEGVVMSLSWWLGCSQHQVTAAEANSLGCTGDGAKLLGPGESPQTPLPGPMPAPCPPKHRTQRAGGVAEMVRALGPAVQSPLTWPLVGKLGASLDFPEPRHCPPSMGGRAPAYACVTESWETVHLPSGHHGPELWRAPG